MSHFPFVLQAMMGMPPPERPSRTETLSDDLEVNFGADLSWAHCENGSANPVPRDGFSTLMGPASSALAGQGSNCSDEVPVMIKRAVDLLRKAGYDIQVIPDNYEPEEEEDSGKGEKKPSEPVAKRPKLNNNRQDDEAEHKYLKSDSFNFDSLAVKKCDKRVASLDTMSLGAPWLAVTCFAPDTASSFQKLLQDDFALIQLEHISHKLDFFADLCNDCVCVVQDSDLYSIQATSGTGGITDMPSTLFEMQRNGKVVAKALCTYCNSEMDNVGPTLELLEVAEKWRYHGLGLALMEAIEHFFKNLCGPILKRHGRVLFSVCYVTNAYASNWFQNNCYFHDMDGMGEELGKYIYPEEEEEEEYDDDDEED